MSSLASSSTGALPFLSYPKGRLIDPATQDDILLEVERRARAAGPRGVVVFDLDSTLLDNRARQARILREYGAAHGHVVLQNTEPKHFPTWNLADTLHHLGVPEEEAQHLLPKVRLFWRERFFTSEYCYDDTPLPGAVEYVRALLETGCRIVYCTGRHTAMGEGTVTSFRSGSLPLPDQQAVHLLLKPNFEMNDDAWKQSAVRHIDAIGEVVGAFDNEPAHVNVYATAYPAARVVHLATDDSGRPIPLAPGVPSIAHFIIASRFAAPQTPAARNPDRPGRKDVS
jgi:hypothetical protein